MIKINVSRTCAETTQRERLTSGMQGVEVSFFFSADWDGLVKTAVFEGSGQSVDVLLTGASCEMPPEVLKKYGGMLRVGVYGVSANGTTVIPTVYADLGIIRRGADPQKDPTTNSSLPVWAQLQAQIGDLANLTTEAKTNLVAAINEAALSDGGSGGKPGKDGTGIESITYKGEDEDGGNVYTVLLTDGTSYDITAPKGATGADGKDGANGKDGSPGKDGTDGTKWFVSAEVANGDGLPDILGAKTDDLCINSVTGEVFSALVDASLGIEEWYSAGLNLKGPKGDKGDKGDDYALTSADKTEIAGLVVADGVEVELADFPTWAGGSY